MSYHTIIFQFLSIGRNATITLQKTSYCADKLFVCCIRLHTQYLFSVSRSMNIWVECRVESVDAVIQYCIAICRYRDTNSVIGIISGMFFTFVNEWNTVCKIPRPKFSVQFGVDFLYICCSFIIGKTCQKCCIPFVGVSLPVIFKNFFTEAGSRYGISCPHCRHTSHKWNKIGSIIISLYEGRYTVCRFYHILFICFSP